MCLRFNTRYSSSETGSVDNALRSANAGGSDFAAVSNGSACTSRSYAPSHILAEIGLPDDAVSGAIRLSWCHLPQNVDWRAIAARIDALR